MLMHCAEHFCSNWRNQFEQEKNHFSPAFSLATEGKPIGHATVGMLTGCIFPVILSQTKLFIHICLWQCDLLECTSGTQQHKRLGKNNLPSPRAGKCCLLIAINYTIQNN
jgi:hypothetical protein